MRPLYVAVAAAVFAFSVLAGTAASRHPATSNNSQNGPGQFVIAELFTSEGCSSCPPADALLKRLSEEQPIDGVEIIALEEHIDYWNHQGWIDPFSSRQFSVRQEQYASSFHNDGVYTPQLIIDGSAEVVGSRPGAAEKAIQRAATVPKASLALKEIGERKDGQAAFQVSVTSLAWPAIGRPSGRKFWASPATRRGRPVAATTGNARIPRPVSESDQCPTERDMEEGEYRCHRIPG